jgi:hypothetical protein
MLNPPNIIGNPITKTLTFNNDAAGTLDIFTVTGDVVIRIKTVCITDITSAAAGNLSLGTVAAPTAIIANTVATTIDARMIWHDATPDAEIEAESTSRDYIITDGNDVVLTLSAQIDAGTLIFYGHWFPLSNDANVVAA